ncbi:MAG: ankyrin repeat domain-containing protein [Phycisphaerae bacterium]|nr:ankyrin repeat domain-containing protein [Phycisphaerae bacterium]
MRVRTLFLATVIFTVVVLLGTVGRLLYRRSLTLADAIVRGDVAMVREKVRDVEDINAYVGQHTYLTLAFRWRAGPREGTASERERQRARQLTYDVAAILIEHGADVDAPSKFFNGSSPLHMSVYLDMIDVTELLLASGASVRSVDDQGFTSLMMASAIGRREFVDLLLQKGSCEVINARDDKGNTALHLAVDPVTVELLLVHGADPNIANKKGATPADLIRKREGQGSRHTGDERESCVAEVERRE